MTLEDLLDRLQGVPVDVQSPADFPQTLRLVVSSHCEQRCQYPDEGRLWCHNEGLVRDGVGAPRVGPLLDVARGFRERHDLRSVKIGGLEPHLGVTTFTLIRELRAIGYEDVGFTTHGRGVNGHLGDLRRAGLTRLTLSLQHLEREGYRRLTGRDGLAQALELVDEAHRVGLSPVKVNRVLLAGHTDDLPAFVEWATGQRLHARLFDLMWQPGHEALHAKYFVPWQQFLPLWEPAVEAVRILRYPTSWRTRVLFRLRSGGTIEVNLAETKSRSSAAVCRTCHFADVCAEGYLGCGVRITPDLKLSPCVLRNDLARDVRSPEGGSSGGLVELGWLLAGDAEQGGSSPRCTWIESAPRWRAARSSDPGRFLSPS
jgi:molybdenum cofactor biosynthesis enzyme MoaA